MKGCWNDSTALRWSVASVFLIGVLTGQALAAGTFKGRVTVPSVEFDPSTGFVVAASEKLDLYRVPIEDDGSYVIENVVAGTYTLSALVGGLTAPDVKGVVLADGQTVEQNFAMQTATPFCVFKSATPIPLDQDIDSPAFANAEEIRIGEGKHVGVGPVNRWGPLGGPQLVSGRFKVKYSDQAIHLAGDITFKNPLVNNKQDNELWNGNALEFDIQNDPYDPTRTGKDPNHNWQIVVGLGRQADWWEHNVYNMRPRIGGREVRIDNFIRRVPKENGEKLRLDVPWAILLQGDETGDPIPPPADNSLGALDIVLDVSDPEANPSEAVRLFQIQWSGFGNSHWNASSLVPVRFCTPPQ